MRRIAAVLAGLVVLVPAACGGSDDSSGAPLRAGVYEYELTKDYLRDHGISQRQVEQESGKHKVVLRPDGTFTDSWRTAEGLTGACSGTFSEGDGRLVTFKWTSGCFGDWEMKYAVEADRVSWSDQKALPPYDADEDQNVTEVFTGVPWTRTGSES
jgi:hypothetical protein